VQAGSQRRHQHTRRLNRSAGRRARSRGFELESSSVCCAASATRSERPRKLVPRARAPRRPQTRGGSCRSARAAPSTRVSAWPSSVRAKLQPQKPAPVSCAPRTARMPPPRRWTTTDPIPVHRSPRPPRSSRRRAPDCAPAPGLQTWSSCPSPCADGATRAGQLEVARSEALVEVDQADQHVRPRRPKQGYVALQRHGQHRQVVVVDVLSGRVDATKCAREASASRISQASPEGGGHCVGLDQLELAHSLRPGRMRSAPSRADRAPVPGHSRRCARKRWAGSAACAVPGGPAMGMEGAHPRSLGGASSARSAPACRSRPCNARRRPFKSSGAFQSAPWEPSCPRQ
jgi:hypothetical protein